jgi:8-oxo-dGTP diphosphatase
MINHLVINVLILKNEKVLLESVRDGGWKLPGGHVDDGESPIDTARREMREELGIEIDFVNIDQLFPDDEIGKCLPVPIASFSHTVDGDGVLAEKHVNIIYAYIVSPLGEPSPKEGQTIKWVGLSELDEIRNSYVKSIVSSVLH